MPRFTFVGNQNDKSDRNQSEITFRGIRFPVNEAVDVDDEKIAEKLRENSHFEEAGARRGRPPASEAAKSNVKSADPNATHAPSVAKGEDPKDHGAGQSHFGKK